MPASLTPAYHFGRMWPMRILVAPDSFGGTLTAREAAEAIAAGWSEAAPKDTVTARPLSDGGPGFVDVLHAALGGTLVAVNVPDPLGRTVPAVILVTGETAYVESAQAAGLHLVAPAERDPLAATTYGVGVLLAAAAEAGARTIVTGLGGTATNDGGAGAFAALGAGPVGEDGAALPYGATPLLAVTGLAGHPQLRGAELVLAADVDNPMLGINGASAGYGPQKGASREDVQLLDAALTRWSAVLERDLPGCPPGLGSLPGGGAAGGLGAALLALGGRRESGIGLVRRLTGLDAALDAADLVITGEGACDWQSLRGKVMAGIAEAALERGVPCLVLAGRVDAGRRELAAAGVSAAYSLTEHLGSTEAAMSGASDGLRLLAGRVAREW
ncbi:MAG: glycerate 2-kinase, partial [Cryptosporangiaceae bacterium]|nr:glycerate 2-kinase [Cryptosporangiaceae bacterium]